MFTGDRGGSVPQVTSPPPATVSLAPYDGVSCAPLLLTERKPEGPQTRAWSSANWKKRVRTCPLPQHLLLSVYMGKTMMYRWAWGGPTLWDSPSPA